MKPLPKLSDSVITRYCRDVPGFDCAGVAHLADIPTGDYFDFVTLPDGEFAFALGESSDTTVAVDSMIACVRGSIRASVSRGRENLTELAYSLNRIIYTLYPMDHLTTCFYGQYDPHTHVFRFVNAGHEPPLLLQSEGRVLRLEKGGAILGLRENSRYREGAIRLHPGDRLIAFTHAVVRNLVSIESRPADELLTEIATTSPNASSSDLAQSILDRTGSDLEHQVDRTVVVASVAADRPNPLVLKGYSWETSEVTLKCCASAVAGR